MLSLSSPSHAKHLSVVFVAYKLQPNPHFSSQFRSHSLLFPFLQLTHRKREKESEKMAVTAVHQFAQCITCHAWSPDQSSNSLPFLLLFSCLDAEKRYYRFEFRKEHDLELLRFFFSFFLSFFEF